MPSDAIVQNFFRKKSLAPFACFEYSFCMMKNEMKNEKKQETVTITTYQWCDIQDQYVVVKVEKAVKNKSID